MSLLSIRLKEMNSFEGFKRITLSICVLVYVSKDIYHKAVQSTRSYAKYYMQPLIYCPSVTYTSR